jgi:broad specificity phosphatase PhoE
VQSAQRIAEILGLGRVRTVDNLIERDFGPAEGIHLGNFDEETRKELMCAKESDEAVKARALEAFRYIAQRHRAHNVILVGHGNVFQLGLSAALGDEQPLLLNGDVLEYPAEYFLSL